jgi:hypothetical protein
MKYPQAIIRVDVALVSSVLETDYISTMNP